MRSPSRERSNGERHASCAFVKKSLLELLWMLHKINLNHLISFLCFPFAIWVGRRYTVSATRDTDSLYKIQRPAAPNKPGPAVMRYIIYVGGLSCSVAISVPLRFLSPLTDSQALLECSVNTCPCSAALRNLEVAILRTFARERARISCKKLELVGTEYHMLPARFDAHTLVGLSCSSERCYSIRPVAQ